MEHEYGGQDPQDTPSTTSADGSSSGSDWSTTVARLIANQVRLWRERRGLSAQQLSQRTRDLGYTVPRSVIANLETGRRDAVSVAELLVLAAALDVPPVMLVTPVGIESTVEILPGVAVSPWRARGWILGAIDLDHKYFSIAAWQDSRRAISLYDIHRLLVREHQQIQTRIKRLADQIPLESATRPSTNEVRQAMLADFIAELANSIDRIRIHRARIKQEGFVLPELPPALATFVTEPESEPPYAIGRTKDDGPSERMLSALVQELLQARRADPEPDAPD